MFTKLTTTAALVLGMTASTAAFAGGNTTANAPSTPTAAADAAAFFAETGKQSTAVSNGDGSFTITYGGRSFPVSSASVAAIISLYGS